MVGGDGVVYVGRYNHGDDGENIKVGGLDEGGLGTRGVDSGGVQLRVGAYPGEGGGRNDG